MDLTTRWPVLAELISHAAEIGDLEVWGFGSMLKCDDPGDLDIAVLYNDRTKVNTLRNHFYWELANPPVDLLCFTHDEDEDLAFLAGTQARRLT